MVTIRTITTIYRAGSGQERRDGICDQQSRCLSLAIVRWSLPPQLLEKEFSRSSEHDTELLWLKTEAIKAMREAIMRIERDATDDVLIAALMLAVFDTGDKIRRRPHGKVQSRKALTYKLDAEFYAALDVEWKHLNVFYDLVQSRGGILTMQPSALRTSAIL